jgi:hypothetical protein
MLDPELEKYLSKDEIGNNSSMIRLRNRGNRGVKSSVAIAAAITAYARIAMSKFKNLDDNPYLGGDTDSAIMQYELDDKFVGKGLGLMKLEGVIKKGLFADKKLYYTEDDKNIVIKARGVGRDTNGADILNYECFIKLLAGQTLTVKKTKFMVETDHVRIHPVDIRVRINPTVYRKVEKEISLILKGDKKSLKYEIANSIMNVKKIG